ncbi:DUF3558 domain-containing protein [Streptomyces termitum]|uniref:DUF3558 domain-containing protein n=1 Tax=Streptomyces termitum TaxID=67368 RepID=A0A918T7D6_9ACTN|nr:DUF3558 domain-containing protein [Streptomyces termitum]GHB05460.1 hypothetical protein GCM10010305_55860 [Streptomyces termitum]
MQRTASRLTRLLACAAVPVMLVVAGCSSDAGSGDGGGGKAKTGAGADAGSGTGGEAATPSPKPKPTVEAARFAKLPQACQAVTEKTTGALVPKAKAPKGTAASSTDLALRGGCSWNGLEDKGVKGSQYRWLDVSFYRYDSEASLGSGQDRARENFEKEVAKVQATENAQKVSTAATPGIGDEAKTVTYTVRKTGEDFVYSSVVARTGNVLVLLTYNGTGYWGAAEPELKKVVEGSATAAKEAVASVAAANK